MYDSSFSAPRRRFDGVALGARYDYKTAEFRLKAGRGLHSSTFWLDVSTFCGIRWVVEGFE